MSPVTSSTTRKLHFSPAPIGADIRKGLGRPAAGRDLTSYSPSQRTDMDREPLDDLARVQILGIEHGAARAQRGGDDEGIIEAKTVLPCDANCCLVRVDR